MATAVVSPAHVSYLREHSIGSILRSSFQIYRENFRTLFLIYTLPILPFLIAQQEAQAAGATSLGALVGFLSIFVSLFAFAAITVAISDTCLGERPTVMRSYRRLGGLAVGRLAWANFLQMLAVMCGVLLLVVPGVILMFRLLFTPIVATIENCRGTAALKRSASLGKGFHGRNLGVLVVLGALAIALFLGIVIVGAVLTAVAGEESMSVAEVLIRTLTALFMLSLYPLMFTAMTLMYYDLRVRKEAYDLNTLAEDLRR
jgi:hypothetical protein